MSLLAGLEKHAPGNIIPLGKKSSLTAGMGLKPRSSLTESPKALNNKAPTISAHLQRLEAELQRESKLQVKTLLARSLSQFFSII